MLPSLCNSSANCSDFFSESLFIITEFGINDVNNLLLRGVNKTEIRDFVPEIIKKTRQAIDIQIGLN
ncbi:hypothetical protein QJS04_geneDACA010991 [Acorus gramineus]|uniref:Acetyl-CoA hydrolase/transferase C-terminal domain-containing protein n=1 Tax=Acorus gramineus TaxID=55184 RepID=A0AAV9BKF1_ACOGR|nr:hypothetical protein QJS04_geneDACA010991 [Acorus gramineus]